MDRISRNLQELINTTGPGSPQSLNIIITLDQTADWSERVRNIQEKGFHISSQEEAIRAIAGSASISDIQRISEIPDIQIIELDEEARSV